MHEELGEENKRRGSSSPKSPCRAASALPLPLPQQGWCRQGCSSGSHCPGEVTPVWALTENTRSLTDTRTAVPSRAKRKRKSPDAVQHSNNCIQLYENCPGTAPKPRSTGQCADRTWSVWWPWIRWSSPRALDKCSSLPVGTQGYQGQSFSTCSLEHSILLAPCSPFFLPQTDWRLQGEEFTGLVPAV